MSEDSEEYDSDNLYGRRKWIPIKLPDGFKPNKTPQSGIDYLYNVMYEAKNFEGLKPANIDRSKLIKNQTIYVDPGSGRVETSQHMLPTEELQKKMINEFTEFRQYVVTILPSLASKRLQRYQECLDKMDKEYPKFSYISKIDMKTLTILFELIVEKLSAVESGCTISNTMGCWIYTLLCILPIPVDPDIHNSLRNLARSCALIRSQLSDDAASDTYKHLNMLICIIARYFGQLDLADK